MLNTAKVHEEEFLKKESSVTNPISNICSLIIFLLVLFCFCLFVCFFFTYTAHSNMYTAGRAAV